MSDFQKRVVAGIELEGYTILSPRYTVSRKMAFHKKGTAEKGERFGRDTSIGTEYNSRPFSTLREGFFLLKAGLRKYNTSLYPLKNGAKQGRQVFLVGGWRDRFAGAHVHLSVGKKLTRPDALRLSKSVHDHIPLLIAIAANSPVWADRITGFASNRVLRGSKVYFRPVNKNTLTSREFDEVLYSPERKTKPATLEIRVMDSNLPEFILAATAVLKAACLASLKGRPVANRISHFRYLRSRVDAARRGMKANLCWRGTWIPATEYLNRFIWEHRSEFRQLDVPEELWITFKLLKKGLNGAAILQRAAGEAYKAHPQTWQRRFARRYSAAISELLSGNSILDFLRYLEIPVPDIGDTWLGRKGLKLG